MGLRFDSVPPADSPPSFQPSQIVCLESENIHLYAEVIQLVDVRQVCWVRPLALIQHPSEPWNNLDQTIGAMDRAAGCPEACLDLRHCSDLLLPWMLFRAAIDTEVMPIFSFLYADCSDSEASSDAAARARQQMHQFIHKICQTYPEAFKRMSYGTGNSS
jgi:hypothetical protein